MISFLNSLKHQTAQPYLFTGSNQIIPVSYFKCQAWIPVLTWIDQTSLVQIEWQLVSLPNSIKPISTIVSAHCNIVSNNILPWMIISFDSPLAMALFQKTIGCFQGVYGILNTVSGRLYIGSALHSSLWNRTNQHFISTSNDWLAHDMNTFGQIDFAIVIFWAYNPTDSDSNVNTKHHYIRKLEANLINCYSRKHQLYNLTNDGHKSRNRK